MSTTSRAKKLSRGLALCLSPILVCHPFAVALPVPLQLVSVRKSPIFLMASKKMSLHCLSLNERGMLLKQSSISPSRNWYADCTGAGLAVCHEGDQDDDAFASVFAHESLEFFLPDDAALPLPLPLQSYPKEGLTVTAPVLPLDFHSSLDEVFFLSFLPAAAAVSPSPTQSCFLPCYCFLVFFASTLESLDSLDHVHVHVHVQLSSADAFFLSSLLLVVVTVLPVVLTTCSYRPSCCPYYYCCPYY